MTNVPSPPLLQISTEGDGPFEDLQDYQEIKSDFLNEGILQKYTKDSYKRVEW